MFGFWNRSKGPFTATILPSGKTLVVKGGSSENLLKNALDSGLRWPHSCRVGSCGTCRCKLVSGAIKPLNDFSYVLSGEELDAGYILACQTALKSDITVEIALEADGAGPSLARDRTISGRIAGVETLTHDILKVQVELDGEFTDYLPGQYADVMLPGVIESARSYSFANSPGNEKGNTATFFIRRVPNGELTEWLFAGRRVGDPITLNGPRGSFYLRKAEDSILLIAGGSGLAPIRALLQQIVEEGIREDVTLLFGARTQRDLYCHDDIAGLKRRAKGKFRYIPVLSSEPDESDWIGERGLCADKVSADMFGQKSHAYVCGPPGLVDAAVTRLTALGLGEERIYFDKFLDASTMPGHRSPALQAP